MARERLGRVVLRMGTWCQGCDAPGQEGLLKAAEVTLSGANQKGLEGGAGGTGSPGEHPVWGAEGHLCNAASPAVLGEVAPGLLGVGVTKSGSPLRPAWALWCVPLGPAKSL